MGLLDSLFGTKEREYRSLIKTLRGNDVDAIMKAATTLEHRGERRAVQPLLKLFERDDRFDGTAARMDSCGPWIRAADALGILGDPEAIEPLAQVVSASETTDMLRSASLALARLGDGRGVRRLLSLTSDEEWEYSTATIVYCLRRVLEEAKETLPIAELRDLARLPVLECFDTSKNVKCPVEDCRVVASLAEAELNRRGQVAAH